MEGCFTCCFKRCFSWQLIKSPRAPCFHCAAGWSVFAFRAASSTSSTLRSYDGYSERGENQVTQWLVHRRLSDRAGSQRHCWRCPLAYSYLAAWDIEKQFSKFDASSLINAQVNSIYFGHIYCILKIFVIIISSSTAASIYLCLSELCEIALITFCQAILETVFANFDAFWARKTRSSSKIWDWHNVQVVGSNKTDSLQHIKFVPERCYELKILNTKIEKEIVLIKVPESCTLRSLITS